MTRFRYSPAPRALALTLAAVFAGIASSPAAALPRCVSGTTILNLGISAPSHSCEIAADQTVTAQAYSTALDISAIGTLVNAGMIIGSTYGVSILDGAAVGALDNVGTISTTAAGGIGLQNLGTVGQLTNSGQITSAQADFRGIRNGDGYAAASIAVLQNRAGGSIIGGTTGIHNAGNAVIGTLFNDAGAMIESGGVAAMYNSGLIQTLTNAGAITGTGFGGTSAIRNDPSGVISSLSVTATGTVSSGGDGIANNGAITSLSNAGSIQGSLSGIAIGGAGTVGTLTNLAGGTIRGGNFAITNTGSIGSIVNAGTLAGGIDNSSMNDLHISGGTGAAFGVITGSSGGIGTIRNMNSDVYFDSGNQQLNANILAGGHTVTNTAATVQVNNPIDITGNYTQGAAATLLIGVSDSAGATGSASDTGYGRLVVSGTATIEPGSSVSLKSTTGNYGFAAKQRYVVVQAAQGATYNDSQLNYSIAGVKAVVTGATVVDQTTGDTNLVLAVASVDAPTDGNPIDGNPTDGNPTGGSPGGGSPTDGGSGGPAPTYGPSTRNAMSSLGGLQRYSGISDAALLNLYNASLAIGSTGEANRAGSQLGPSQSMSAGRAAFLPTLDAFSIIGTRVNGLRLAQGGMSGIATGDAAPAYGAWGEAFGGHASQDMVDSVSGYSANYGGLMIGADRRIGDRWTAGGAFSYSNTLVKGSDYNSGSSTRVNTYGLLGYADYTGDTWYANLSAGIAQQRYDSTRAVDFTGFSGSADGAFSGQQYMARAEFGYPLALGGMSLTPIASLTYGYLHQNAYTESGGNGSALAVDATHANSLRSTLGARLEKAVSTKYGDLVPFAQLQWIHEFVSTRQITGAAFVGAPGETAFTTVGATPVSDLADLSLGVTLLRANNLSLTARYELQVGSQFVSNTGTIRLQQLF